jgi:hypothetical protein
MGRDSRTYNEKLQAKHSAPDRLTSARQRDAKHQGPAEKKK